MALDASVLNEAERAALRLLAQGHTAKSIAAMTGRSESAVNERLREARRKTGVGSSRELARLLAAQEAAERPLPQKNRDEEIGVAGTGPDRAAPLLQAVRKPPYGTPTWRFALMALLVTGTAALALALSPLVQDVPASADPLIGAMMGEPEDSGPQLYRALRDERRAAGWAPQAEAALAAAYAAIPGVASGTSLRVICAATLCEVAGTIRGGSEQGINATMQALQGSALRERMRGAGFADWAAAGFGSKGEAMRFYAYWRRAKD